MYIFELFNLSLVVLINWFEIVSSANEGNVNLKNINGIDLNTKISVPICSKFIKLFGIDEKLYSILLQVVIILSINLSP